MIYSQYTVEIHNNIGKEIFNKHIELDNSETVSFITQENIIEFCNKYKKIDENIIGDILKIWSYEKKIKYYYTSNGFGFNCHDWINFKPILYIILDKIGYFN